MEFPCCHTTSLVAWIDSNITGKREVAMLKNRYFIKTFNFIMPHVHPKQNVPDGARKESRCHIYTMCS